MNDKQKFIMLYFNDYVKMAYRRLNNKVDENAENILVYNLYMLLDEFCEGELSKYVNDNIIV